VHFLQATGFADGVHATIKVVEGCVRQPRFIEMQRVDGVAKQLLDHVDVVENAVVG